MNEDLIKLLSRFFLQCSQLACIEEANRTMDFLCQMERLFRYWTRADNLVSLKDEVNSVEMLLRILQLNTNCSFQFICTQDLPKQFIERRSLLDYVCESIPLDMPQRNIGSSYKVIIGRAEHEKGLEIRIEETTREAKKLVQSRRVIG